MDTWTLKKGYPVVKVERNLNESLLSISQEWFLLNPKSKVKKNIEEFNSYKWYVPFTFSTKANQKIDYQTRPYWLKPNVTLSKNKFN